MKTLLLSLAIVGATAGLSQAAIISMTTGPAQGGAVVAGTFTLGVVGTAAGVNNWPAAETPDRAVDTPALPATPQSTKYLNFAELNTGIILTPTTASDVIGRITFVTANDAPERDPLTFSLYGSATPIAGNVSIASLTAIVTDATTGLDTNPGRFTAGPTQVITNSNAYAGYVLIFPTVRTTATANSMQIGDIRFETIPEPATGLLAALSALGLVARRRRA